jgi:iron complex transport system permease protein
MCFMAINQPDDAIASYKQVRRKCAVLVAVFSAALLALMVISLGLGVFPISARDILRILGGKITGLSQWYSATAHGIPEGAVAVIWELRLPRIMVGILSGAGLAVAGVIFQAILQNPLADPYTLGISTGAAFGASLAIFLNLSAGILLPVPLLALAFSGLTLALVLFISRRGNGLVSANLIMAGIIMSAILSAGISFMKMLSGENVGAIVFWLMGSLSARSWRDAALLAPVIPLAAILAGVFAADLNILTLGNREAEALGVAVKRTRFLYLLLGSVITAVCVSVCGVIGFVGLVIPHLLRLSVTSDNRLLIPLSALLGGLLLCAADTCVRLLASGEIPVGVLTTLLGGPFFIFIFLKKQGAREL